MTWHQQGSWQQQGDTTGTTPGRGRTVCPRCGSILRRDNPGPLCSPCERRQLRPGGARRDVAVRGTAVQGGSTRGDTVRDAATGVPVPIGPENWLPPENCLLPEDFFARGHVQRAVRELDFGALFRAVREDRRWSQETLGEVLELDQPRICKIESGRQRLRDIAIVARISRTLGIPPALMGFSWAEVPGLSPEEVATMVSDRREFLAVVAAMVLGSDAARLPGPVPVPEVGPTPLPQVGLADIERIESTTQAFRLWGERSGAALSRGALTAQLDMVRETARTARCATEEVHRRLLVATGDLASVTGRSSYDAEHHAQARQIWLIGLEAARAAGNPDLMARLLWSLAHQSLSQGRPEQALQYLRLIHAALSDYRWEQCAETRTGAILGEAWAHALMGHEDECRRLMGLAEDHFARRTDNAPLPPWRTYFDEPEFTGLRGHSLHVLALRQPSVAAEAHELLVAAAASRTEARGRVRAMNHITVTATCFQGGDDIPGGIESARTTLELLSALDAPRVRSEARVLLDVTEPYAHHPDVADLRHDLTQALPPGPTTTVA